MKSMIGYYPATWWKFCWVFATPAVCMVINGFINNFILKYKILKGTMIFGLVKYQPVRLAAYNYDYPVWGHIFGWFLSLSSMLCIPVYAIYIWIVTDGTTSEVKRFEDYLILNFLIRNSKNYSALKSI